MARISCIQRDDVRFVLDKHP